MPDAVRIPLRARDGGVRAYAWVDQEDAHLADYKWSLRGGYARRATPRMGGKQSSWSLHREVMGLESGDPREVDHINLDRLDCRRENLRIVTRAQNKQNTRARRGARSKYRGVSLHGGRWQAEVKLDGVRHYLGSYDDELEAARAASGFRRAHAPFAVEVVL